MRQASASLAALPARQRLDGGAGSLAVSATRIGLKAGELLAGPGFSAEILALFSGTLVLAARNGEILWVCREGAPLHRRGIFTSHMPAVDRGERCHTEPKGLAFERGASISLDGAPEWVPREVGLAASPAVVWARWRQLLTLLALWEAPEGLGPLIPLISALAAGQALPAFAPRSLAARSRDLILSLAQDCRHQDLQAAVLKGRELIGLGTGLTPSGDDFLGGLLFATCHLQRAYPRRCPLAEPDRAGLLAWARAHTHPISYALFADLVEGHGPEALHGLAEALLRQEDDPLAAASAALALTRIGHASGWDMLAGFMTGILMIENATC